MGAEKATAFLAKRSQLVRDIEYHRLYHVALRGLQRVVERDDPTEQRGIRNHNKAKMLED
jgi:hypothetical protein